MEFAKNYIMQSATNQDHNTSGASESGLRMALAAEQHSLYGSLTRNAPIRHHGDRGEENEKVFIDLLKKYLPRRYSVDKGHILDHTGNVSQSLDILIYDRHFTPVFLDGQDFRYVLAEAVYAVFDCKPSISKHYIEQTAEKVASARSMRRTLGAVYHHGGVEQAKPHFDILGGILAIDTDWVNGVSASCESALRGLQPEGMLNIGYAADGNFFNCSATDNDSVEVCFTKGNSAFAAFIFGLMARLQKVASARPVDWAQYANHFSMEEKYYV